MANNGYNIVWGAHRFWTGVIVKAMEVKEYKIRVKE
jgi:hypothetical protein